MDPEPSAIREALTSGETDRVNAAIDAVDDLEPQVALDRFEAIHEFCTDAYDEGIGQPSRRDRASVRVLPVT